jgi:hypothetical protein
VLLLASAFPRFHDLGHLSFYSDEMLTYMSARSVLEGDGAAMPSGMPYDRGLPFTLVNAAAASALGEDKESSYRLTAAVFGTVTPAVLFVTGTAFVSPPAAFVAASMLALSEWHVAFSRFARMYSPFLLFFILSAYYFWRWATEGGRTRLVLGLLFFACTVSLHLLGVFAAQFALLPLVLPRETARPRMPPPALALLAVGLGAPAVGYLLDKLLIGSTYAAWSLPPGFELAGQAPRQAAIDAAGTDPLPVLLMLGATLLGGWLGWVLQHSETERNDAVPLLRRAGIVGAGAVAGAFLGGGHLWGALLAAIVLLLARTSTAWRIPRGAWLPLLLLTAVAAVWSIYVLQTMGLYAGSRRLTGFPFPYPTFFWFQFPGLVLLFAGALLWLLARAREDGRTPLAAAVLGVLLPTAAIGVIQEWGGTRYLFHVYPYMLLAGAAVLVHVCSRLTKTILPARGPAFAAGVALLVVLSGATGAHGIVPTLRVAALDHGQPIDQYIHIFPFRPDHRSPGLHVRDNLEPGDVVIAEDVQAQFVYAGQVDYWFRRAGDARKFLYLAPDGKPRDIYVNSVLASAVDVVEEVVRTAHGRVWFITSGETALQRDWYLSEEQRHWLERLEATMEPVFTGEDGATRVYCLDCGRQRPHTSAPAGRR